MSIFKKATKAGAKLRLAVAGPSGSGKTFTAMTFASVMGPRVAVLDTERGSASKYADRFEFDVVEMAPPFHPDRFCKVIAAADEASYDVLVIDSLTHAWKGEGGLLQIVDEIAKRKKMSTTFRAWADATPIQERFVNSIMGADLHIIATVRSKQDYALEKDDKGRVTVTKRGLAPEQRDGLEYEFDFFVEMDVDHRMVVSKSRAAELADQVVLKPGKDFALKIKEWLA